MKSSLKAVVRYVTGHAAAVGGAVAADAGDPATSSGALYRLIQPERAPAGRWRRTCDWAVSRVASARAARVEDASRAMTRRVAAERVGTRRLRALSSSAYESPASSRASAAARRRPRHGRAAAGAGRHAHRAGWHGSRHRGGTSYLTDVAAHVGLGQMPRLSESLRAAARSPRYFELRPVGATGWASQLPVRDFEHASWHGSRSRWSTGAAAACHAARRTRPRRPGRLRPDAAPSRCTAATACNDTAGEAVDDTFECRSGQFGPLRRPLPLLAPFLHAYPSVLAEGRRAGVQSQRNNRSAMFANRFYFYFYGFFRPLAERVDRRA